MIKNEVQLNFRFLVGTPCGHIFHKKCLKEHLERSRRCPVDRNNLPFEWVLANFNIAQIDQLPAVVAVQMNELLQINEFNPPENANI